MYSADGSSRCAAGEFQGADHGSTTLNFCHAFLASCTRPSLPLRKLRRSKTTTESPVTGRYLTLAGVVFTHLISFSCALPLTLPGQHVFLQKSRNKAMGITEVPMEGGRDVRGSQTEPMSPIEEEQFYSLEDTEPLTSIRSENPREQTDTSPYSIQNEERSRTLRNWIRIIGRGKKYRFAGAGGSPKGWPSDDISDCCNRCRRRESKVTETGSITSSSNLRMVKTASFDMQSLRTVPRPRSNTQNSNQRSVYGAISAAGSDVKVSTDDFKLPVDAKAWSRAVHRREVIKEMIETETSYLASLRILADVRLSHQSSTLWTNWLTLIPQILSTVVAVRSGLRRSTQDLVCLHESLLADLKHIKEHSSSSGPSTSIKTWSIRRKRERNNSSEPRPGSPDRCSTGPRKFRMATEARIRASKSLGAEPSEAAEAAEILDRKVFYLFRAWRSSLTKGSFPNLLRMRIIVSDTT